MSDSIPETRFFSTKSSPSNWALNKAISLREEKRPCAALCMVQVSVIFSASSAVKNLACVIVKVSVAVFALTIFQIPPLKAKIWSKLEAHCLVGATAGKTLKDLVHHVYNVVMFLTFSPLFCFFVGSFSPEKCKKAHDAMGLTAPQQKKLTEEKVDEPSQVDESTGTDNSTDPAAMPETPNKPSHVQTIISQFQTIQTTTHKIQIIDQPAHNVNEPPKVVTQTPKPLVPKPIEGSEKIKQPTTPIEVRDHHDNAQNPEPKKPEPTKPIEAPPSIPTKPIEEVTPSKTLSSSDIKNRTATFQKKIDEESKPPLPKVTVERKGLLDEITHYDKGSLKRNWGKSVGEESRKSEGGLATVLAGNSLLKIAAEKEKDRVRESTLIRTPSNNDGWDDEEDSYQSPPSPVPVPIPNKSIPPKKEESPAAKKISPIPSSAHPSASQGKSSKTNTKLFNLLKDETMAEALSLVTKRGIMNRDTMNRSEAEKIASLKAKQAEEAKAKRRSITEDDIFKKPEEKDRLEEEVEEAPNLQSPASSPTPAQKSENLSPEESSPKKSEADDVGESQNEQTATETSFTEVRSRAAQKKAARQARRAQEQAKLAADKTSSENSN